MTTIQHAIDEFILASRADGIKSSTLKWYTSLLGAFEQKFSGSLKSITTHDLREYFVSLRNQGYAPDTVSAHIRALHKFWGWCAVEYDQPNPMKRIRYPQKPQAKPKAATLEDVKRMFEVAGEGAMGARNRAILAFMLDTGVRAGGLCGLRVVDVDLAQKTAVVTEKGDKRRVLVFTQFTADLLREWMEIRQPAPHLFYDLDTLNPLKPNGLYQLTRRLGRRAGVQGKFNPHSFRHLFALEYIKSGGDLATLSKLLGHRDLSTTAGHYLAFTDNELREKHEKHSPVKQLKKPSKGLE